MKSLLPLRKILTTAGMLAALSINPVAWAIDYEFNVGNGSFLDENSWDPIGVPTDADRALILNDGTATLTTDDVASVTQLVVASGGLEMTGGDLIAGTDSLLVGNLNSVGVPASVTLDMSGNSSLLAGGEMLVGNGTGGTGGDLSTATVNLSGQASLQVASWLVFGRDGGTATVTLSGDSSIEKLNAGESLVIGDSNGTAKPSVGRVTVQDTASMTSASGFQIGKDGAGDGMLTVQGSGEVSMDGALQIGLSTGAQGTLRVEGGTVTLNGTDNALIGDNGGTGTVSMTAGTFSAPFIIGSDNGQQGFIAVGNSRATGIMELGGNAIFSAPDANLVLGKWEDGKGTVTVSDNASLNVKQIILGSVDNGSAGGDSQYGVLNLNGGTVTTSRIVGGRSTSGSNSTHNVVNANGGTIKATAGGEFFTALEGVGPSVAKPFVNIESGGLKFDTNGNAVVISQNLTGVGGLTKLGAGTLTLTALSNSYEGNTLVEAGILSITTGFLDDGSNVVLSTGSVFDLNFSGTDTIAALSFGGTFQELGTWGSFDSEADHKSSFFSGTGMLLVTAVPEPSTIGLGLLGLSTLAWGRRGCGRERPKAKPVC